MERGKRKWKENEGRSLAQCSKVGVSLWTVSPTDAHLVSGLISCLVLPCCTAHLLEGQKGSQGQSSLSRRVSNEIIQSTNPPHCQELLTHTAQQLDSVLLETSLAGAVTWWQEPGSEATLTWLQYWFYLTTLTSLSPSDMRQHLPRGSWMISRNNQQQGPDWAESCRFPLGFPSPRSAAHSELKSREAPPTHNK